MTINCPILPLLACAVAVLPIQPAVAQRGDSSYIRARYHKREVSIRMRDGVSLFTAIYEPRDTSRSYPILLTRTPYSVAPYGSGAYPRQLGPAPGFVESGYIFVSQDVRGRYRSEGHFVHMTPQKAVKRRPTDVDESTDTYDTVDWLVKNVRHSNGRVGLWGISYSGFFAAVGLIDAHPAMRAVSPQAPQADWFAGDDTHHNGAFFLTSTFNFMAACGRLGTGTSMSCVAPFDFGNRDGYAFFLELGPLANVDKKYFRGQVPGWTEMMEHGTYDQFWKARNILPHVRKVTPAVLTVGGWYDANNFYGALHLFEAIEKQSPETDNAIVIGPWYHGQWARDSGAVIGPLRFGSNPSVDYWVKMILPFFEHHLKGRERPRQPKAYVFETGANRWRTFDAWPPRDGAPRTIYLAAGKALSFSPPTGGAASKDFEEYVSDPARPVPFVPGPSTDMDPDYMAQDQRFAADRQDVLVYRGDPLGQDLTIAGPVTPSILVSSTGTDGDWIVKLIDVHPDGFQELVRGDVVRAKFRSSLEKPVPLIPGQVTRLEFEMPDVLHTIRKGHRLMVQVQSSWFPLVDRNPQTFVDIYRAGPEDFRKATVRVWRGSGVKIGVLGTAPVP